jgi:hypothetical protein
LALLPGPTNRDLGHPYWFRISDLGYPPICPSSRLPGHVALHLSMSPMRGDVKERFSLRPLREEMDLAIGIQPYLRC